MKTFTKMAAQGDFVIIRIDAIPSEVENFEAEGDRYVIAKSETHHDHTITAEKTRVYKRKGVKDVDLYELFMVVNEPSEIIHNRSFDTHETILVPPGNYNIRRQREYTPEGYRRAAD
jgi:hypothetical protein